MSVHVSLTPLGIAALALLVERAMHPYEMYQLLVQRHEDRIVKVRPGSLYHTVDRLERHGFVRPIGTEREGNRPERTTYDITATGRLSLGERVAEMLSTPVNEYPSFPLAIGEAHNLPKETVIDLLERRLTHLRLEAGVLESGAADVSKREVEPKFWINVRYQQAMLDAEIEWIDGFVADLESGAINW